MDPDSGNAHRCGSSTDPNLADADYLQSRNFWIHTSLIRIQIGGSDPLMDMPMWGRALATPMIDSNLELWSKLQGCMAIALPLDKIFLMFLGEPPHLCQPAQRALRSLSFMWLH